MRTSVYSLLALTLAVFVAIGCESPPPSGVPEASVAAEVSAPAMLPLPPWTPAAPSRTEAPPKDTRSSAQIAEAACWGFEDGKKTWRCDLGKKPKTFMAASSTPIIPSSWTVPNWFVNKLTGSDSNDCVTALTACKTKQEIWVHRFGCFGSPKECPRFRQNTVLEQDASDTDNTDPLYAHVALENGANFTVQCGAGTTVAATFTRNTAKNRTVGANALLSGSFSAGAPAVGMQVVNTTAGKSSSAWVYSSAGGANWNLTQPLAPTAIPVSGIAAEVDTWNTNDTVNLIVPIALNIDTVSASQTDVAAGFLNRLYVTNCTVFDTSSTTGAGQLVVGNGVMLQQMASQRALLFEGNGGASRRATNILALAGMVVVGGQSNDPFIIGGAINTTFLTAVTNAPVAFDGDVIIGSGLIMNNGGFFGFAFLDSNVVMTSGQMLVHSILYGGAVLYGSGANTIDAQGSSHVSQTQGTYVATFTAPGLVTGLKLNSSTTVETHTGANPDVINSGVTATPTNLDGAGVPGAFHLGGASTTKTN